MSNGTVPDNAKFAVILAIDPASPAGHYFTMAGAITINFPEDKGGAKVMALFCSDVDLSLPSYVAATPATDGTDPPTHMHIPHHLVMAVDGFPPGRPSMGYLN